MSIENPMHSPQECPHAELLAQLAAMAPGPAALAMLNAIDLHALDDSCRLVALTAWERQQRWLAARIREALVVVAGPQPTLHVAADGGVDEDIMREEIACALGISASAAAGRMHEARTLHTLLPETGALLASGDISWSHALAMVDAADQTDGDADALARLEARVLPKATGQSVSRFRRAIRDTLTALRPDVEAIAHEVAKAQRSVQLWPTPGGMATLSALLPAAEARAAFHIVDELAKKAAGRCDADGVKLGIDARRADALLGLVLGFSETTTDAESRAVQADVQVVVDLPTLLRLADHPAQLVGYGAVPAHVARELAADGRWRRLITDPITGHLLDYGRTTYRPPKALADFVRARDRTCTFPGCGQPAARCDLDHREPWERGGPTSATNCGPLCRRHHRLKTHWGWRLLVRAEGGISWISRAGLRYDLTPPRTWESDLDPLADDAWPASDDAWPASDDTGTGTGTGTGTSAGGNATDDVGAGNNEHDADDGPCPF